MNTLKEQYPILEHVIEGSSHIQKIEYDTMMSNLVVHFKGSGKIYEFYEVPKNVWEEFCESESAGKFFNSNIRNKFEYRPTGSVKKETRQEDSNENEKKA